MEKMSGEKQNFSCEISCNKKSFTAFCCCCVSPTQIASFRISSFSFSSKWCEVFEFHFHLYSRQCRSYTLSPSFSSSSVRPLLVSILSFGSLESQVCAALLCFISTSRISPVSLKVFHFNEFRIFSFLGTKFLSNLLSPQPNASRSYMKRDMKLADFNSGNFLHLFFTLICRMFPCFWNSLSPKILFSCHFSILIKP